MEPISSSVPVLAERGFYFVKLYAYEHESLFGEINNGSVALSEVGRIAADEWNRSARAYATIHIDEWAVLPNRLEGIVSISPCLVPGKYDGHSGKPRLLSSFVASYKAAAAKRINLLRNAPGSPIWQRSYQERFLADTTIIARVRQMLQKHAEQ